jgi:hypothetical protein
MPANSPIYSVDASALIEMKDVYPIGVFPSVWAFVASLGDAGRLLVAEPVRRECQDPVFTPWFAQHPQMVLQFSVELNQYTNALQAQLKAAGLPLVNPQSPKSQNDPFVVAAALLVEKRNLADLRTGSQSACHVITYEKNRGANATFKSIRDVCDYYHIKCLQWPEMLQLESWSC